MYKKNILFISIFTIIFSSCSQPQHITVKKYTVTPQKKELPSWIKLSYIQDNLSASGKYINNSSISFINQRDNAIKDAQKNLYTQINSKLIKTLNSYKTTTISNNTKNSYLDNQIKEVVTKISENIIKKAKVLKLYKSEENTIYVLISVQIDYIKDEMEKIISQSFNTNKEIYQNFIMAKSDGSIDTNLH